MGAARFSELKGQSCKSHWPSPGAGSEVWPVQHGTVGVSRGQRSLARHSCETR